MSEIYEAVEEIYKEGLSDGLSPYFNEAMMKPNPRTGKPRYIKNIQAALVLLTKKGLTERVQRGYYRITEMGRKSLEDYF